MLRPRVPVPPAQESRILRVAKPSRGNYSPMLCDDVRWARPIRPVVASWDGSPRARTEFRRSGVIGIQTVMWAGPLTATTRATSTRCSHPAYYL